MGGCCSSLEGAHVWWGTKHEVPGGPSRLQPGLLQTSTPLACPRTVGISTCPMDWLPSQSVPPQVPADSGGQGTPSLLLQKPLLSCVPHCYTQEVSRICHLSAGTYRIVPSTYLPDTEGAFTVTIATRIDRWGGGGAVVLRTLVPTFTVFPACLTCPAVSCPGIDQGLTVSGDSLPVSLWRCRCACVLGRGLGLTQVFFPTDTPFTARKSWGRSSKRYMGPGRGLLVPWGLHSPASPSGSHCSGLCPEA